MSQSNSRAQQQQRLLAQQIQAVDVHQIVDLLHSPRLLELFETQLPEYRERDYPPATSLAMFLGQALSADRSCQNAVNGAMARRALTNLPVGSANTGGYCRARQRLPVGLIHELLVRTGQLLIEHTPEPWQWRGRYVKLIDGTTTQLPDSPRNQTRYPQQTTQAQGAGHPIMRLVGVMSLATGAVLDVAMGPCKGKGTGEHGLLRELTNAFVPGDVVVADSYYCTYFLLADMVASEVDVVVQQHGARKTDFRRGERLGPRDHVVCWRKPAVKPEWMTPEAYARYPQELKLRETKVGKKVLVSTFLKPGEVCKDELDQLYRQRWHVELNLRHIKTTLGMEMLSCKTPEMCEKEVRIYMLAYNLIRVVMAQAAASAGVSPLQLSFKHTLQVWLAWRSQCRQGHIDTPATTAALLKLIAQVRVGRRPGRVEPRLVKRRPKPFGRLKTTRQKAREKIMNRGRPKRAAA